MEITQDVLNEAMELVINNGYISTYLFQRHFKCGYSTASKITNRLCNEESTILAFKQAIDKYIKKDIEQVCDSLLNIAAENGYDDYWFYSQCITGEFLIQTFFEEYFKKKEGFTCCTDKARYTVNKIKEMIKKKKTVFLSETYREYQNTGGDIGSIKELDNLAYWCPKTISDTKEAMELFYKNTIQRWKMED